MTNSPHPAFRSSPDSAVNSASRVPTAAVLRSVDRLAGSLVVNRWTYRPLRLLMRVFAPKVDTSGTSVIKEFDAGRGCLIVRPDSVSGDGAVFLIHGGGYVIGSNRDALGKAAMFARKCGVPVICPAYRLAPQDPFPAASDDCLAGWQWLLAHTESLGLDSTKLVVGGISAGGGLAAGLVQRLHDAGGIQPAAQLLVYPMVDDGTAARRELDKPRHRVWSNRNNRFGWTSYLGHSPGQEVPAYAVPARRHDLSGLPPAWIGVGTADLFLDENRMYAQRLADAGVEVDYVEVAGAIHGFDQANVDLAEVFNDSQASFIRRFTC